MPSPAAMLWHDFRIYQAYTRHTAIRRGNEEGVGIMLPMGGFVTAPGSAGPGIVPLKLKFESLDGFTINELHEPKVWQLQISKRNRKTVCGALSPAQNPRGAK